MIYEGKIDFMVKSCWVILYVPYRLCAPLARGTPLVGVLGHRRLGFDLLGRPLPPHPLRDSDWFVRGGRGEHDTAPGWQFNRL